MSDLFPPLRDLITMAEGWFYGNSALLILFISCIGYARLARMTVGAVLFAIGWVGREPVDEYSSY